MHKRAFLLLVMLFLIRCIPCGQQGGEFELNLETTSILSIINQEFLVNTSDTVSAQNFYFRPEFKAESFSQLSFGFVQAMACDPVHINRKPLNAVNIVAQDTINGDILPDSLLNAMIEVTDYQMASQSLKDFNEALSSNPDFLLSGMRFRDLMPYQNLNIRVEVHYSNGTMQATGFRNVFVIP